jgi:hypothetical protein
MSTTSTWPVFESALVSREMVAERTMSFRFEQPADWSYRAGQDGPGTQEKRSHVQEFEPERRAGRRQGP